MFSSCQLHLKLNTSFYEIYLPVRGFCCYELFIESSSLKLFAIKLLPTLTLRKLDFKVSPHQAVFLLRNNYFLFFTFFIQRHINYNHVHTDLMGFVQLSLGK